MSLENVAKLLNVKTEDVLPIETSEENLFQYYAVLENHSIQMLVTYDRLNNKIVAVKDVDELLK